MKILIADDHAMLRKGTRLLLQEEFPFAQITEVGDAAALLKAIMKEHYSLVITDISMPPGDSGLEVTTKIKSISPSTPVILFSMHAIEDYALRAFKAGASAYLWKNGSPSDIIAAVKQVISGKKYISPEVADLMADTFGQESTRCIDQLSNRELEVYKLIAEGKTTAVIAAHLHLSINTINSFRAKIFEKMGFKNAAELIRFAVDNKHI